MSWQDQGRQSHGWFGDGTAPARDRPVAGGGTGLFAAGNETVRIDAIAHGVVAHMPRADRHRTAIVFDGDRLALLRKAVSAWMGASSLGDAAFLQRFVSPQTGPAALAGLRAAAEGVRTATSHQDLAEASGELAGAIRSIGLDRWPGSCGTPRPAPMPIDWPMAKRSWPRRPRRTVQPTPVPPQAPPPGPHT